MPEPKISPVQAEAVVVLRITTPQVRGDAIAVELSDAFHAALDRSGASKVVIDFKDVEFLSSVGFRPLLSLHQRVKHAGGRIILCNLAPVVEEVLLVTRFIDPTGTLPVPFAVRPDLPSAVSCLFEGP
jgi:anti-anti-sigma factor